MTKFDDVFLGILQHCGKIEPFLDAIFYFLSRRTDFFQLMHSKDDKLGFPPGFAERMLIKVSHCIDSRASLTKCFGLELSLNFTVSCSIAHAHRKIILRN